jgi:hypothetical protein
MAFNPFNWFRKHQKVFFAGLTILCMIVFIGQFGAGDVFTRALAMFGGSRSGGPVVISLYGKKVREGDIQRMTLHRKMANDFLLIMVERSHEASCRELLDKHLKGDAPDNPLSGLREVVLSVQQRTGRGLMSMMFLRRTPAEQIRSEMQRNFVDIERIASRDKVRDDPERLTLLRRVATMIGFQRWLFDRLTDPAARNSNDRLYFGGDTKLDQLLDFVLWEHQADRLGVQLTEADIKREVIAEAAGHDVFDGRSSFENDRIVQDFLTNNREYQRLHPKDLLEALRDEFRVVIAQGALLGTEPGVRAYRTTLGAASSPAVATPDEFLHFFREQRTSLRVKLLTVPVAQYLAQVKEQPPESELLTRFETYKEQEPRPFLREPGFKEPRRIRLEYVTASPKDPYYAALGKDKLAAWAAAVYLAGNSPLSALVGLASDPLAQEYEMEVRPYDFPWFYIPREDPPTLAERQGKLHFTSVIPDPRVGDRRGSFPAGLVSTLGLLMGGGSPLTAASSLRLNATFAEVKTSLKFSLTQLLANSNPQELFGNAALLVAALPPPPSMALVEPMLLASVQRRLSEEELTKNMRKFRDDVKAARTKSAPADFLAKGIKDYRLKLVSMSRPMTREALVTAIKKKKDTTLDPLREALLGPFQKDNIQGFVEQLFGSNGAYEPAATQLREQGQAEFVYWRAQDLPAQTRTFSTVRAEVVAAWRLEKARQLARKEAERLEDEINKGKLSAAEAQALLAKQKLGPLFELDEVSRLVAPRETLANQQTEYSFYRIPEDKADLMEYPLDDLAKQLLALKRPGEATVIADMPAKHYYVAVLVERNEPSLAEFKALYARTPSKDTLYMRWFLAERRTDFRRSVMEQLRREATNGDLDKDGKFKVADNYRQRESTPAETE